MRFRLTAPQAGSKGLRVLPEFPDLPICRIEGRNGIGKTLAARLLELASGIQPYTALPHAWSSLVSDLGHVEILIDGFDDGAEVKCVLNSHTWADRSMADVAANPGDAFIDGVASTWPDVRKRFQVRRIAGDEGLQETLGRILRERSLDAESTAETIGSRLASWSLELRPLQELTRQVDPKLLDERRAEFQLASTSLEELTQTLNKTRRSADALSAQLEFVRTSIQSAEELPVLLAEYQVSRRSLDAALAAASEDERLLVSSAEATKSSRERALLINRWARLLQLRERARDRAEADLQRWRRAAGLTEGTATTDLKAELQTRLREVEDAIELGYVAGNLRTVITDVTRPLEKVPTDGLGAQTFLTLDRPITGTELRDALLRRSSELQGIPKPDEVVELERERDSLNNRLRAIGYLPGLEGALERKQELLDEANREWTSITAEDASDGTERSEILTRLAAHRRDLTAASGESGRLAHEISGRIGLSPESLGISSEFADAAEERDLTDERIQSLAEGAGLPTVDEITGLVGQWIDELRTRLSLSQPTAQDLDALPGALEEKASSDSTQLEERLQAVKDAQQDVHRAEDEYQIANARLTSLTTAIRASISEMVDERGTWSSWLPVFEGLFAPSSLSLAELMEGLSSGVVPDGDAPIDFESEAAAGIARLHSIAHQIEENAAELRSSWGTMAAYLDATARRLAPRIASTAGPGAVSFIAPGFEPILRRWTELELAEILSTDALRRELFDGAAEISIDLDELAVQWRTGDGQRRRRPLEAFSSGEQVFAYTRAKLEQYAELKTSAERTTVILDEFGAFVARDRFGQLMKYVEQEALGRTADQVIVMVPLSGNTPALSLPEDAAKLESDLSNFGYFAVAGLAGAR